MKNRRFKKLVKVILAIMIILFVSYILALMIESVATDFEEIAKQCDLEKGSTCSYYETRQYIIGG